MSTLTQLILPSNMKSMSIEWNASWFVKLSVLGIVNNRARERASVFSHVQCCMSVVMGYTV